MPADSPSNEHTGIPHEISRDDVHKPAVMKEGAVPSNGLPIRPSANIWLENTKSAHQHGGPGWEFGSCLWSPSKAKGGKDWYNAMRAVQTGDLILHSSDGELRGFSYVKRPYLERHDEPPHPGTWGGMAPYYRIDLERFTSFQVPLAIRHLFEQHGESVKRQIRSIRSLSASDDYRRPPFDLGDTENLKLGQTYLTHCTPRLYEIIRGWASGNLGGAESSKELAPPFDEIFETPDEANSCFDLIRIVLLKLGIDPSTAENDKRICLSLTKRPGEGVRLRLNFGKWAILTFLNRSVGEDRILYVCRADMASAISTAAEPRFRFADMIDDQSFDLARCAIAVLRNSDSREREAFEESLSQVARHFKEWSASQVRKWHKPIVLRMVFDSQLRSKILTEGLILDEPDEVTLQKSAPTRISHWWLNANPRIWDFRNAPIGFIQTYTSHNEEGNKRQKYEYFTKVKPGDLVLGYLTSPHKEVVAVFEVTKALHATADGEVIEIRMIEKFLEPVTRAELQSVSALAECEPLINNMGSLFAVTDDEYETIRSIIDERNADYPKVTPTPFTTADALRDLFMAEADLDRILARLKRKKAIILQGPPGVGKTFIARRLAYAIMEMQDERRVKMVQFHPSYGYEDFVQGYRPTRVGLERRDGVFHEFARLARNDPGRQWFFIIDEINRGNLAKIFGELLMLLEADKRGPEHAIPLTYSEKDERFDFPANLHVIGTMNTADRSLAMVDYALRRRFAFVTLGPAFDSPAFAAWLMERGASGDLVTRIRTRVNAVNEVIEKERDLGAGFRIGHSYFCPPIGHAPDEAWYREVIDSEIQPLLEEYFDSRERVQGLVSDLLA